VRGTLQPLMRQADRAIDWAATTPRPSSRIRAADGFPGVADTLFGEPCHLFDAHPARLSRRHARPAHRPPRRRRAAGDPRRRPVDRPREAARRRQAAATVAFAAEAAGLPDRPAPLMREPPTGGAALPRGGRRRVLSFDFYNGAMSTDQCRRLIDAIAWARTRPTRVLVLAGGRLLVQRHPPQPHRGPAAGRRLGGGRILDNINAIDDVCLAILQLTDRLTVAALRGNAGAPAAASWRWPPTTSGRARA
jgi:putative two-component system hydrogenase maturation factor HypX/HoxX